MSALLLGVHAGIAMFVTVRTLSWSYAAVLVIALLALYLCWRRSIQAVEHNKPLWWILFGAILAKTTALALLFADSLLNAEGTLVMVDPSFYFCMASLLMIAAATYNPTGPMFRWTTAADTLLAIALAAMFYVTLHHAVDPSSPAASASFLILLFDGLDAFVALFATIRLLGTRRKDERRFFFVLATFAWVDGICAAAHNRLLSLTESYLPELLLSIPLLVLGVLVSRRSIGWLRGYRPSRTAIYLSGSVSPFVLCLALCALVFFLLKSQPVLAMVILAVALTVYAARNAIVIGYHLAVEDELRLLRRGLQYTANHDELTGLQNRRGLFLALRRALDRTDDQKPCVSLAMLDVDRFKGFNDAYGHLAGDACLTLVAQALRAALTVVPGSVVARYGGEEFVVVLPGIDASEALGIIETVRQDVYTLGIANRHGIDGLVTISAGIATHCAPNPASAETLLNLADEAVYRAKAAGRNRTM
nr:GGDEF domain-containing protein [Luteibacter rhizovicinus]